MSTKELSLTQRFLVKANEIIRKRRSTEREVNNIILGTNIAHSLTKASIDIYKSVKEYKNNR